MKPLEQAAALASLRSGNARRTTGGRCPPYELPAPQGPPLPEERSPRELELITAEHTYEQPGRYIVAVKVIDIFGNDTMTLVPVNVG